MSRVIPLKQSLIDTAIHVGKITAGLLANKVAVNYKYGGSNSKETRDVELICGYIKALINQKEINEEGAIEYITYTANYEYELGDEYGGGLIFYKTGNNVLISAESDISNTSVLWGKTAYTNVTTQDVIGSGQANTTAIITSIGTTPPNTYAAYLADSYSSNGKTDWYLPSKQELEHLIRNRDLIGGFDLAPGSGTYYWSSSQYYSIYDSNSARKGWAARVQLGTGSVITEGIDKKLTGFGNKMRVRAIRSDVVTPTSYTSSSTTTTDPKLIVEDWMNQLTDEKARIVIEKIYILAKKNLPKLVFNKILENKLTLL